MRLISTLTRTMLLGALAAQIVLLTGCGIGTSAAPSASTVTLAVQGHVHGGQQPVSNAKIYLYVASTSGYAGVAASILDGVGYATSDSGGNFSLTGRYSCQPGDLLYVLATNGNPGLKAGTDNAALQMMSALGSCDQTKTAPFITINEATTVASAYALAAFMTDGTHVGTSSTNIAGLKIAFANASNLIDTVSGMVRATTPAGNGTVPLPEIYSLANALAGCVNSDGTTSACTDLFTAAKPPAGSAPSNTLTAILDIAKNPSNNAGSIYTLSTPTSAFQPVLHTQPADWAICIQVTAALYNPQGIAIDAQGDVWIANAAGNTLSEVDGNGTIISTTYAGGGMSGPTNLAIDLQGNVWVTSPNASTVAEFSSQGVPMSGTGYKTGGINDPTGIAVDGTGLIWVANEIPSNISKINGSGVAQPNTPYTNGVGSPYDIALDNLGTAWVFNTGGASSLLHLASDGSVLHSYPGYGTYGALAVDSANSIWVANYYGSSVSKLSSTGATLGTFSGSINFPFHIGIDGGGNAWLANSYSTVISRVSNDGSSVTSYSFPGSQTANPGGIAADASGTVWMINGNILEQFIGAGTATRTPFSTAIAAGKLATQP